MKCPSKKELADLQRRFRTDKKIAELLGVKSYLVTYWRRKKGILAYSSPKYAKGEVMEVWEHLGDDKLAGQALGISGNAFRYWRKKYGITDKPVHLKFEQIQLPLPGLDRLTGSDVRKSFLHKIIESRCDNSYGGADTYLIDPDRIYVGDFNQSLLELLKTNGIKGLKNPSKVFGLYPGNVVENGFRKEMSKLHDYGNLSFPTCGGHVFDALSKGHILPSELVISCDPAVIGAGAIGALGLQATECKLAEALATGKANIQKFDVFQVVLLDHPPKYVHPLDIVMFLKSRKGLENMAEIAIEYSGDSIDHLDFERRFTLCYLSRIFDCISACIPCDKKTEKFLRRKAVLKFHPIQSDPGHIYYGSLRQSVLEIELSIGILKNGNFVSEPLSSNLNRKVDTVIAGFYSGGMYKDIIEISAILNRKKVNPGIRMFIRPATQDILLRILEEGVFKQLVMAGCSILPPSPAFIDVGCPAIQPELGSVLVTDPSALPLFPEDYPHPIYLANHQIAGISALNGCLSDPRA